jgi:antitoxin MazE
MRVQISKWGNSTAVRLPKAVVDELGLKIGQEMELVVEGHEARLKPVVSIPIYRLADLYAEMDRLGLDNAPPVVDWGPDVGAEVIDDAYSRGEIDPGSGGPGMGGSKADKGKRAGRR